MGGFILKKFDFCWPKPVHCLAVLCGLILVSLPLVLGAKSAYSIGEGYISWANGSVVRLADAPDAGWSSDASCSSELELIEIDRWASLKSACLFGSGDGLRLARYSGNASSYLYAVNFPTDDKFYPIYDFCVGVAGCVYSQSEDSLIYTFRVQAGFNAALIKNFSSFLSRHRDAGGVYYRFDHSSVAGAAKIGLPEAPLRTGSIGLSKSGRWAVVELRDYGLARVDLRTLQYKRVLASGSPYGYGSDPTFELAISDSGKLIARGGWNGGLDLIEVDDACGDVIDTGITSQLSVYASACTRVSLWGSAYPGMVSAHKPRFSNDGMRLSLRAAVRNSPTRHVVLAPGAYADSYVAALPYYVAFGDSFTSGEGEHDDKFYQLLTNTDSNKCHVSVRSYPYLVGSWWGVKTANRSCSGSKLNDVKVANRLVVDETKRAGIPTTISISVGGNDINLMGKLKTCLNPGTCSWSESGHREQTALEIKGYFNLITSAVLDIMADHPLAAVAIVGYPSVVNVESSVCGAVVGSLLSVEERRYLNESVKYLNKVLLAAANYTKASFIDVENSLIGERLCDLSEKAMNGIRLGDDIPAIGNIKVFGSESFHPTPRGHELVSKAIINKADAPWQATDCSSCTFSENQLSIPSYWLEGDSGQAGEGADGEGDGLARLISKDFLSRKILQTSSQVGFKFGPGSFLPGSNVVFELHSDARKLSVHAVEDDGSVAGWLDVPNLNGYHTVHALGLSYSESPIDIYEIVLIGDASMAARLAAAGVSDSTNSRTLSTLLDSNNFSVKANNVQVNSTEPTIDGGVLGWANKPARSGGDGESNQRSSPSLSIYFTAWLLANVIASLSLVAVLVTQAVKRHFRARDAKRLDGL